MNAIRYSPIVLLLLLSGCGRGSDLPPLVPVSGIVTLDGQPLADAEVNFMPNGTTRGTGSHGRTDANGKYTLKSRKEPGAVVGEYRVTISKWVMPDGSVAPIEERADTTAAYAKGIKDVVPGQYSHPASTTLTGKVPDGGGEVNFELKSAKKK